MNKVNQQVSKYIPAELQNLLDAASSTVSQILSNALFGNEVSEDDGTVLFNCRDNEKVTDRTAIFAVADILRQRHLWCVFFSCALIARKQLFLPV